MARRPAPVKPTARTAGVRGQKTAAFGSAANARPHDIHSFQNGKAPALLTSRDEKLALFSGTSALAGHEYDAAMVAQQQQQEMQAVAVAVQHVTVIGHRSVHA